MDKNETINMPEDSGTKYGHVETREYVPDSSTYKDYRQTSEQEVTYSRWLDVQKLYREGTLIESKVIAVERSNSSIVIVTTVNDFRVIIPDKEYFLFGALDNADYQNASDEEKLNRRYTLARAQIGALITFRIKGMSAERSDGQIDYSIVASRVEAMKEKEQAYFYGKNRIVAGNTADARVLSVSENFVIVETFGVESIVNVEDLSAYTFVNDCRDYTAPGDTLRVKVKKVHYIPASESKSGVDQVVLNVSSAAIEADELEKNVSKLSVGSAYSGKVRNYNRERDVYTIILDLKALVSVRATDVSRREMLKKGDSVFVEIKAINGPRVFGTCRKIGNR